MLSIPYNKTDAEYYGEYYPLIISAAEHLSLDIKKSFELAEEDERRNPIEHINLRIKSASSMRSKLRRRGIDISIGNSLTAVHDVIGIRIVCTFVSDVYHIATVIRDIESVHVSAEKDYIRHPKQNGYRSYHMVCSVIEDNIEIAFEIQLRTVAMDCWASLEHQIKYKKEIPNQEYIVSELKNTADILSETDERLEDIRKLIDHRQN